MSYEPNIKQNVEIKLEKAACEVIEDRLTTVGSVDIKKTPIIVDCNNAINWLKPTNSTGIYLFFKEDNDCEYDYE